MHTQSPSDTHSVYTGFVRSSCSQSYRLHNPLQTMSGEKQRSHPQKHSCQTHMVTPAAPSLSPSPPTQTDTSIVVLYKTLNSTKGFWHYHCFLFIYLFFILQFCDGSLRKDMSSRNFPLVSSKRGRSVPNMFWFPYFKVELLCLSLFSVIYRYANRCWFITRSQITRSAYVQVITTSSWLCMMPQSCDILKMVISHCEHTGSTHLLFKPCLCKRQQSNVDCFNRGRELKMAFFR